MTDETYPSEQDMKQMDEMERQADAAIRELEARQIDDLIFEAENIRLSAEINYELRRIAEQQLIDDIEEELNS